MKTLKEYFNEIESKLQINFNEYKGNRIDFSYYNSANNWSHSVSIIYENEKIFFQTYRINAYEDLKPYKFTNYSHGQIGCKIPISEQDLIFKTLTEYDKFKFKR